MPRQNLNSENQREREREIKIEMSQADTCPDMNLDFETQTNALHSRLLSDVKRKVGMADLQQSILASATYSQPSEGGNIS